MSDKNKSSDGNTVRNLSRMFDENIRNSAQQFNSPAIKKRTSDITTSTIISNPDKSDKALKFKHSVPVSTPLLYDSHLFSENPNKRNDNFPENRDLKGNEPDKIANGEAKNNNEKSLIAESDENINNTIKDIEKICINLEKCDPSISNSSCKTSNNSGLNVERFERPSNILHHKIISAKKYKNIKRRNSGISISDASETNDPDDSGVRMAVSNTLNSDSSSIFQSENDIEGSNKNNDLDYKIEGIIDSNTLTSDIQMKDTNKNDISDSETKMVMSSTLNSINEEKSSENDKSRTSAFDYMSGPTLDVNCLTTGSLPQQGSRPISSSSRKVNVRTKHSTMMKMKGSPNKRRPNSSYFGDIIDNKINEKKLEIPEEKNKSLDDSTQNASTLVRTRSKSGLYFKRIANVYHKYNMKIPEVLNEDASDTMKSDTKKYSTIKRRELDSDSDISTDNSNSSFGDKKPVNSLSSMSINSLKVNNKFNKFNQINNTELLNKILRNEYLASLFLSFLKNEHSEENLEFYLDLQSLKTSIAPEVEIKRDIHVMIKNYFDPNSEKVINIDSRASDRVRSNYNNPSLNNFDLAEKQIFQLLKQDCLSRFINCNDYKNYMIQYFMDKSTVTDITNFDNNSSEAQTLDPTVAKKGKNRVKKKLKNIGVLPDSDINKSINSSSEASSRLEISKNSRIFLISPSINSIEIGMQYTTNKICIVHLGIVKIYSPKPKKSLKSLISADYPKAFDFSKYIAFNIPAIRPVNINLDSILFTNKTLILKQYSQIKLKFCDGNCDIVIKAPKNDIVGDVIHTISKKINLPYDSYQYTSRNTDVSLDHMIGYYDNHTILVKNKPTTSNDEQG